MKAGVGGWPDDQPVDAPGFSSRKRDGHDETVCFDGKEQRIRIVDGLEFESPA